MKGAQCSETVKSRAPRKWFVWKRLRFSGHPRAKVRGQGPLGSARTQPCKSYTGHPGFYRFRGLGYLQFFLRVLTVLLFSNGTEQTRSKVCLIRDYVLIDFTNNCVVLTFWDIHSLGMYSLFLELCETNNICR